MRKKAYLERIVRLAESSVEKKYTIYKDLWNNWIKCRCLVRGRFVKPITLPDGSTQYLGLSNACVCLHEVDSIPYIITTLAPRDLYRLRDELLHVVKEKLPIPPEPWPPYVLERSLVSSKTKGVMTGKTLKVEPLPSVMDGGTGENDQQFLQKELQPVFTAVSATTLRQSLIARVEILKLLACKLTLLYGYLKKEFIKCTTTDAFGYFETVINYSCSGDKPDLYFQACQCIGSFPHMVYDPGVACHTHWNYQCGTELSLIVTDPAAIVTAEPDPIEPPPEVDSWIMPWGIGSIRVDQIQSDGLVDHDFEGSFAVVDAPFGGTLRFRQGFSGNVPNDDIYYYRWLYRQESAADWTEFDLPVHRHYVREEPGKLPVFPLVTLGPKVVKGKNLYRFKPSDPDQCDDVLPGGNNAWPTEDWFHEIYSGFLNSKTLPGGVENAHGPYLLKLEIYSKSGNLVAPGATTFQFIVPDGLAADGETITTRLATGTEIVEQGFVFTLHIDNRITTSTIDAPHIGTTYASDNCGFLRHAPDDQVTLTFHANQDGNHAVLDYWIKRGANTILAHYKREVSDSSLSDPLGNFTGDGDGNFTHDFPNATLRDTCTSAAFAEILRTFAKATDGHRRLNEYDSHPFCFTVHGLTNNYSSRYSRYGVLQGLPLAIYTTRFCGTMMMDARVWAGAKVHSGSTWVQMDLG